MNIETLKYRIRQELAKSTCELFVKTGDNNADSVTRVLEWVLEEIQLIDMQDMSGLIELGNGERVTVERCIRALSMDVKLNNAGKDSERNDDYELIGRLAYGE